MTEKEFTELANKHLTVLESYQKDENGNSQFNIFGYKQLYESINVTRCSTQLPNIYEKEFNSERIKIIDTLSDNYKVDKSTVRSLFCDGADWYKQKLTK